MREGGVQFIGGDEPAVVGPQLVPGDDLCVVVGRQVLVPGVQIGDQRRAGLDGLAAIGPVAVVVVLLAAGAVAGRLGKGGVGTWRAMPVCSMTVMASLIWRLERW